MFSPEEPNGEKYELLLRVAEFIENMAGDRGAHCTEPAQGLVRFDKAKDDRRGQRALCAQYDGPSATKKVKAIAQRILNKLNNGS